jgi:hypothetical protein
MPTVSLNTLLILFEQMEGEKSIIHMADCFKCGCKVKIRIDRTSGGFGLLGGILYESEQNKLYAKCLDCHQSLNPMPDTAPKDHSPISATN